MTITMTVTSFWFFVLLTVGAALYYLLPKRGQWVVLLLMSMAFYAFAAPGYTIVFPLFSAAVAYAAGPALQGKEGRQPAHAAGIAVAAVALNIGVWFLLKGSSFWITGSRLLHGLWPAIPRLTALPWAGALGMGYYTAQTVGYIIDCYWGNIRPQRNFLKLFLFVSFFPQLTVGPISRYDQLECLYERHPFRYETVCHGVQRLMWGLFKKLVLADRLGLIIDGIWADTDAFHGVWL